VGDRLSEADIERLVTAFTVGTSKRGLAERYGISESSVKRLIRAARSVVVRLIPPGSRIASKGSVGGYVPSPKPASWQRIMAGGSAGG
jgi:hypothetical protein